MNRCYTTLATLALAVPMVTGALINSAAADVEVASNSQLKGQYTGISSGGCIISMGGFDQNDRPIDPTRTFSNIYSAEVVFTFDGHGRGTANFTTYTELRVPGTNASFVAQLNLATGGGNLTYSVGPKGTVTVTLTNPSFKVLSAGVTVVIDQLVLEGHFGPNGLTLVNTGGTIETLTISNGVSFPRICERAFVLLGDRPRF